MVACADEPVTSENEAAGAARSLPYALKASTRPAIGLAYGFFDASAAGLAAAGVAVGLLVLLGFFEFLVGPGSAAAGLLRGRKDTAHRCSTR